MKVTIEIDIPDKTYARIVKWMKGSGVTEKLPDVLEHMLEQTIFRWKERANKYFETGKTAFERAKERLGEYN